MAHNEGAPTPPPASFPLDNVVSNGGVAFGDVPSEDNDLALPPADDYPQLASLNSLIDTNNDDEESPDLMWPGDLNLLT